MALIKRGTGSGTAQQALVLDLRDLQSQADRLKAYATAEAERIIADARAEREKLLSDAREVGHAEGVAQGLEEGRAKGHETGKAEAIAEMHDRLVALEHAWTHALDELLGARERFMQEARIAAVELAVAIAERVTKRTIEADPETVVRQVAEALQLVAAGSRVIIEVHPDDHAAIERALPAMFRRMARSEHAELVEDASLDPGSCVIRNPDCGSIDASVRVQLDRIAETLLPADLLEDRSRDASSDSESAPKRGPRLEDAA